MREHSMSNRKSKAPKDRRGDLPYLADGDAAGLFIAVYSEATQIWRHRGNMMLAQIQRMGTAVPVAGRSQAAAYARSLVALADALDIALDTDRPGDVAMLDVSKLEPAAAAFGRMIAAHDVLAKHYGVGAAAAAGSLAAAPVHGHA